MFLERGAGVGLRKSGTLRPLMGFLLGFSVYTLSFVMYWLGLSFLYIPVLFSIYPFFSVLQTVTDRHILLLPQTVKNLHCMSPKNLFRSCYDSDGPMLCIVRALGHPNDW